jgi:hypothetical protein
VIEYWIKGRKDDRVTSEPAKVLKPDNMGR